MILIALQDLKFKKALEGVLTSYGTPITAVTDNSLKPYLATATKSYIVVVASAQHSNIEDDLWHEMLKAWSNSTALFIHTQSDDQLTTLPHGLLYTHVQWPANQLAENIQKEFGIGPSWFSSGRLTPLYNENQLSRALAKHKMLYHIYIDASAHSNIYTEYGVTVHLGMLELFERTLKKAWREVGYHTEEDLIFRKSSDSSIYLIFTPLPQFEENTPPLGFLTNMAYRLYCLLQREVQLQLSGGADGGHLYKLTDKMLSFSVGYASMFFNPCFSLKEQLEKGIERARNHASVVKQRAVLMEREFLQYLMLKKGTLYPGFQAVLKVAHLSETDLPDHKDPKSFRHLKDHLYGFEALLRINKDYLEEYIGDHIFPFTQESLNPYTLFQIAQKCDLSLELDQICINLSARIGSKLPGALLVNIFPRNFYYIEKLSHMLPSESNVIFELAESRIIKNFDFLLEARERLKKIDCGLATDDVCKGYASFQRLLTVQPDLVKLDREIISGADKDQKKSLIIKTFVEYSHKFGHHVLVEGVETINEFNLCKELGVDYVQGFLWHRPVPREILSEQFDFPLIEDTDGDQKSQSTPAALLLSHRKTSATRNIAQPFAAQPLKKSS